MIDQECLATRGQDDSAFGIIDRGPGRADPIDGEVLFIKRLIRFAPSNPQSTGRRRPSRDSDRHWPRLPPGRSAKPLRKSALTGSGVAATTSPMCTSISSRGTTPSGLPRLKANPAEVVASAWNPNAGDKLPSRHPRDWAGRNNPRGAIGGSPQPRSRGAPVMAEFIVNGRQTPTVDPGLTFVTGLPFLARERLLFRQ